MQENKAIIKWAIRDLIPPDSVYHHFVSSGCEFAGLPGPTKNSTTASMRSRTRYFGTKFALAFLSAVIDIFRGAGGYISDEGARHLNSYQFKGCDRSLMLKYITNPIYNRIVMMFPLWLAPNLITFVGLLCPILSFGIMMQYCPYLEGVAPRWVYLLQAAAIIAYQALDAMDGKQARRTGTSSALGMLFDHGCDALNTTVSSLALCATFQLGAGWISFAFWFLTTLVFYWATIEEYYTGEVRSTLSRPNGARIT